VRFALHRIDLEREAACDDRVVSRTGAAERLAACLVSAATRFARDTREPVVIPGALRPAGALRARIDRLLDPVRDRSARLARLTSLVTVVTLIGAVTVSSRVDPIVVFLEASTPLPNAAATTIVAAPIIAASHRIPMTTQRTAAARRDEVRVTLPVQPATEPSRTPTAAPAPDVAVTQSPTPLGSRALRGSFVVSLPSTDLVPAAHANPALAVGDTARRAGKATGAGARRFGTSIARALTRGGKAVASSF
jgi:hypothetical protein